MHKIEYFTVEQEGKTIVLRMVCPELSERLIINGFQEALLALIKQRQPALLLLDYANVRFSSSETINALIKAYEWLTAQGGVTDHSCLAYHSALRISVNRQTGI